MTRIYTYVVTAPLEGIAVLLADDDSDTVELLEWIVGRAGASVRSASSGAQALGILHAWKPDVLLLDIAMPGMDGYELLTIIRRDPDLRSVPAVALTASTFVPDRAPLPAGAGFSAYVAKPFEVDSLLELVQLVAKHPSSMRPTFRA